VCAENKPSGNVDAQRGNLQWVAKDVERAVSDAYAGHRLGAGTVEDKFAACRLARHRSLIRRYPKKQAWRRHSTLDRAER